MQTKDNFLKEAAELADSNIYISESIKSAVFSSNTKSFVAKISTNKKHYQFEISSLEKNKKFIIQFQSNQKFIKSLISNDIKRLQIYLDNIILKDFYNNKNDIGYKISLFRDNIYNIEISISEDSNE